MARIQIAETGCRSCSLCADICPVQVFDLEPGTGLARAAREGDCIGCLSCVYACPSGCLEVSGVETLPTFHRIEEHAAFVEKFLQVRQESVPIAAAEWEEARKDVSRCLIGLADSIQETIGRGFKMLGREAGALAAAHLPEMYEEAGLEKVLGAMQRRFENSYDFDYALHEKGATLTFKPCGLCRVVTEAGQKPGEATLCHLFHEYWSGLLTTYVGKKVACQVPEAGTVCRMELTT